MTDKPAPPEPLELPGPTLDSDGFPIPLDLPSAMSQIVHLDSREGRGTDADVRRAYNAHWFPVPGEASAARRSFWIPRMGRFRP